MYILQREVCRCAAVTNNSTCCFLSHLLLSNYTPATIQKLYKGAVHSKKTAYLNNGQTEKQTTNAI